MVGDELVGWPACRCLPRLLLRRLPRHGVPRAVPAAGRPFRAGQRDAYRRSVTLDRRLFPATAGRPADIGPRTFWPYRPDPAVPVTAGGRHNVLIVQNLRDPGTPWVGALGLWRALGSAATLLTRRPGWARGVPAHRIALRKRHRLRLLAHGTPARDPAGLPGAVTSRLIDGGGRPAAYGAQNVWPRRPPGVQRRRVVAQCSDVGSNSLTPASAARLAWPLIGDERPGPSHVSVAHLAGSPVRSALRETPNVDIDPGTHSPRPIHAHR